MTDRKSDGILLNKLDPDFKIGKVMQYWIIGAEEESNIRDEYYLVDPRNCIRGCDMDWICKTMVQLLDFKYYKEKCVSEP